MQYVSVGKTEVGDGRMLAMARRNEVERSLASRIAGRAWRGGGCCGMTKAVRPVVTSGRACRGRMVKCAAGGGGDGGCVGGDVLFWHWVSGTRCQFGGDNLGLAVEEQDGQRTGDAPEPPKDAGWGGHGGRKIWYNIGWLIMQLNCERIGRSTTKAFVTSWDNVAYPPPEV